MSRIEIISASAGSGKTYRLAEVLEQALVSGDARPEGILATTFTVKAAAELQQRARSRLLDAGRTADAHRVAAARIGTINSVCGRLVSDFAFVLGLSPRLGVIDETRAASVLARSLAGAATEEDRERFASIASRFWRDFDWQAEVRRVVDLARVNRIDQQQLLESSKRSIDTYGELLGTPAARGDLLDRHLRRVLERFVREVDPAVDKTKKTAGTVERAEEAAYYLRTQGRLEWRHWASLAGLSPGKKSAELARAVRRAAATQDRHPRLRADAREAIERIFAVASRALAAYESYKQAWGLIDFVDQEVKALELLGEPSVQRQLESELDLILVDEFQDTSPLQLALFFELARLARRSVWVGDQKQAIYGFRGTDPALMDAAIEHILGGAEPETLPCSWRSRPELVDPTSDLFSRAFEAQGLPPSRVELASQRPRAAELGPAFEIWQLDAGRQADVTRALAAALKDFLDDPSVRVEDRASGRPRRPRPSDVSVLCRRNATAETVARELQALGVSAQIPQSGLLSTLEARLAVAALRLWVDPRDRLARAVIARLLQEPAAAAVEPADATGVWLEHALCESAFTDLPAIRKLLDQRAANPGAGPIAALDFSMEAVGARGKCLHWGDSDSRLANLDALRALAARYLSLDEESGGTVTGLVSFLSHLPELGADLRAVPAGADSVAVTTWHGAKGLEWPVAVLFELDTVFPPSPLGVRVISDRDAFDPADPLADRWIRYWPNPYHPAQKKMPFHQRLAEHRATESVLASWQSERLRLLYVGWTRTRDRLVLASRPGRLSSGILATLQQDGEPLIEEPPADAQVEDGRPATPVVWAGQPIDLVCRRAAPAEPQPASPEPGRGYLAAGPRSHADATLAPSAIVGSAGIGEILRLGPGIELVGSIDETALGAALHAFYAADAGGRPAGERLRVAAGLIDRWGIAGSIRGEDILASADNLYAWIDRRWPGARRQREWPVHHRMTGGTIVRGAADLVLESEEDYVIIDHKCLVVDERRATEQAKGFAGQLRAYGKAIAAASAKPVRGTFVHLPVSGLAVALEV